MKHYYEMWFYYYGEDDERTEMDKEYTFYLKTEKEIKTREDLIEELKLKFPVTSQYHEREINCIPDEDYDHLSNWFEINAEEFTECCGCEA